ncbi:MAG: hypothetical protein AB1393_11935 [Candidatus Edwardsbacteria bacterium]
MPWHYWVLRKFATAELPKEWVRILEELKSILTTKYIDKIEVAAFSIRGKRIARWQLKKDHAEYSTKQNTLGAAKKLTWLLLKSRNAPSISEQLIPLLNKDREFAEEITYCPICQEAINFEDFMRSGRMDPVSIQMGHLIPLSRAREGHNVQNVIWVHRRCNYIQDEQTVSETIDTLRQILERHGYKISSKS